VNFVRATKRFAEERCVGGNPAWPSVAFGVVVSEVALPEDFLFCGDCYLNSPYLIFLVSN
jgi:hypothetical protein